MDGWACPNVAVQPGSECVRRCGCSVECCQRLMGGGGHIVSAPTKQEGASRASVHMQGLCDLAWCVWCRLGGGWCRRDNCPLYELPTESSLGVQSILKSLTLIQHSLDIQNPMWKLV